MGNVMGTASSASYFMTHLLILIPARNEATTIEGAIASLVGLLHPADRLVVIDDSSTDETAVLAEQAGAEVLRRCAGESDGRKGTVLAWSLEKLQARDGEIVVVLDADARVDENFLYSIRTRFAAGARALQCQIVPVSDVMSQVASLAACSTLMEQVLDDGLRVRLGWPVRLRGTGMAFRREVLTQFVGQLRTTVEDVELSLLLTQAGIHIVLAPEAIVYDSLPVTFEAASRQRARWMAGQVDVWLRYWPVILQLLMRGPGAWSLVGCVLVKPRAVWIALRVAFLMPFLIWPGGWWVACVIAITLLADLSYVCAAVILFGNIRALLKGMPMYIGMWLQSTLLALRGSQGWLRARP
jgi:cellulose synthase/poly-beta-1,6-N-acetylglucosamine synthase-like glycosyltransferase